MIRINFQPYTTPQLETIVKARLECAKEGMGDEHKEVIGPDAIKFASMKVSSISGDARRVLDICRYIPPFSFVKATFDHRYVKANGRARTTRPKDSKGGRSERGDTTDAKQPDGCIFEGLQPA
jgi:hypothetical protein